MSRAPSELRATRERALRAAEALIGPDKCIKDRARFDTLLNDVERLGRELLLSDAPAHSDGFNILPSMREYHEQRAMGSVGGAAGGYVVAPGESAELFDRLRPASVVLTAGPRILEMEGLELYVPRMGSSVSVGVYQENAEITASDPSLAAVVFRARKLAALVRGANEWFGDAPAAREILSMDLIKTMAETIDDECLEGDGTGGHFLGLRHSGASTETELGEGNGTTPSPDNVLSAIERLQTSNARANAIFLHPRTWGVFKRSKDGMGKYLFSPDPSAEAPLSMFGVPVFLSSQISITETVGSSTDCSWIGVADMTQTAFARRLDTEIVYDQSRYLEYDQTAVRVVSRADFARVNDEAVEILTGVRG
ncbi:MAG: phage major capsid protein [Acidobacteria bacterium]|nr:phage major capsid protein [Acidobacteriota bacterium]